MAWTDSSAPNCNNNPSSSSFVLLVNRSTSTIFLHHPHPLCWFLFLYVKRRRRTASSASCVEIRRIGRSAARRPGNESDDRGESLVDSLAGSCTLPALLMPPQPRNGDLHFRPNFQFCILVVLRLPPLFLPRSKPETVQSDTANLAGRTPPRFPFESARPLSLKKMSTVAYQGAATQTAYVLCADCGE